MDDYSSSFDDEEEEDYEYDSNSNSSKPIKSVSCHEFTSPHPEVMNRRINSSADSKSSVALDGFMNNGSKKIDFVLVYNKNAKNELENKRRQFFERNLVLNGLILEKEEAEDNSGNNLIFVKTHAPWYTLCNVAEDVKLKMPLWLKDGPMLRKKQSYVCEFIKKLFDCKFFVKSKGLTRKRPEKNLITWPFSVQNKDRYAVRDRRTFFSSSQRIELAWEVLQKTRNDSNNERKRGLNDLLARKIYVAAFPLHEGDNLQAKKEFNSPRSELLSSWASWRQLAQPQPLRKIQKYFGQKIAFYFAFMDFYLKMLTFPALFGLFVILYGLCVYNDDHEEIRAICDKHSKPGNYTMCPICKPPDCDIWTMAEGGCEKYKTEYRLDNEASLAMSCFTIIWAIIFLKLWKRNEARYACDWDTIDLKSRHSTIRADYVNTAPCMKKNLVTSQMEPHWPFYQRAAKVFVSILITFFIFCIAELCLFLLLVSRIAMYGVFMRSGGDLADHNVYISRFLTSKFVFMSIILFEYIYSKLSFNLTNYETPKTNYDFMNSLLLKLFIFKMLNSFMPISYSAFIRGNTIKTPADLDYKSEVCDAGCTSEVVELIGVILIARLVIVNIFEVTTPCLKNFYRRYKHSNFRDHRLSPRWLKDYHMCEVVLDGIYKEYMEMMIQFAFVVFCVTAFPATPIICFINNIFEIRIDAINLLKGSRRPLPERVRGIQIWNKFMDTIVKMGIIFNAALIAFTSDNVPRFYYTHMHNRDDGMLGYTEYSLSSIYVSDFGNATAPYFASHNITSCYYKNYRESQPPYHMKLDYWKFLTVRLVAFSVYVIGFHALMWFMNTLISDVPHDVKIRMRRRKHIVMKSLESDGALKKMNSRYKRYLNLNNYLANDCLLMCSLDAK